MSNGHARQRPLAIGLALCACQLACNPAPPPRATTPPSPPRATTPQAPPDDGMVGVIVSPETIDVTAQLDGRLVAVLVRAGDRVERDAPLARLDGRSAEKELAVARAELAMAEAQRNQAQLDVAQTSERLERRSAGVDLPTGNVSTVSQEELSASRYQSRAAEAKLMATQATVDEKRARLAQMQLLIDEGALRAPFAGVVATRYLDAGAAVHKGEPVLRLVQSGALGVRFAIDEDAGDVAVGAPVRVAVGSALVAGTVSRVAPEIDAAARVIIAEATLAPEPRQRLRSGQVARVYRAPQP